MPATVVLHASSAQDIASAAQLLRSGELVAVPTETVYGLAADARNPEAVRKIFAAKNRPATHPLIVHIASAEKLPKWAIDISDDAQRLAAAFWPGALTLLLKKAPQVNEVITGGLQTIGLRVPSHPALHELLKQMDTGLAAPSANLHQQISPTTAQHVLAGLSGRIAAVLDGGACALGLESTIVDCTDAQHRILRAGPITAAQISRVLGRDVLTPQSHTTKVAGNMAVHYQPRTKAVMLPLPEILKADKTLAILHYSDNESLRNFPHRLQLPANKDGYAAQLYAALHQLDALHTPTILIETPPDSPEWADVQDRLSKATTLP